MSLLDANMYVPLKVIIILFVAGFLKTDLKFQGCLSDVRLHAYYYGHYDSSRQHLLSRLLTANHLVTFQFTTGQRELRRL